MNDIQTADRLGSAICQYRAFDCQTIPTMTESESRPDESDRTTSTTIPVSTKTRDELFDLKNPTDSYEAVLQRLLEK
jgi:hypothetical protein